MVDFDDNSKFKRIASFQMSEVLTYGYKDREKRELIRQASINNQLEIRNESVKWFGFRIFVNKAGKKRIDIDNVPKLIIDSFSKKQIKKDKSKQQVGLYDDDTISDVKEIQISEDKNLDKEIKIEIFGYVG
jgi:hypothetical protein